MLVNNKMKESLTIAKVLRSYDDKNTLTELKEI